jgi:hypothetical protein
MAIDWMVVTYLVVGFFALVGLFRGWWKEAITTFVLVLLITLLQRPDFALWLVNLINSAIAWVWEFVVNLLNLTSLGGPFQLDPTSAGTWIVILILALGFAALVSRLTLPSGTNRLPGSYYEVGLMGRLLGILLGALNGFLILNLVREYLDGRALPGSTPPETELAVSGASVYGAASNTLTIQAVNLPSTTILDSYLPWLIIGLGFLIIFAVLRTRIRVLSKNGGRKVVYTSPYGYRPVAVDAVKEKKPVIEIPLG